MLRLFDRIYSRIIFLGLAFLVWFAALGNAAHDLWSSTLLFCGLTLLSLLFLVGRFRDKKPIKLPLLLPCLLLLAAFYLSTLHSYDVQTTWQDFWGWTYVVLGFFLFLNIVDTPEEAERFMLWAGAVVLPIALYCVWQRFVPAPPSADGAPATVGLFGYGLLRIPFVGWTFRYGHWEIHATLINSVVMAGFILSWVLLYLKRTGEDRRFGIFLAACALSLFFARSTWSLAMLTIGLGFYYQKNLNEWVRRHSILSGAVLGILVLAAISVLYAKLHHQPEGLATTTSYHGNSRWYYALTALSMWKHHLWTGVGLGGFATAYPYFKTGQVENTLWAHGFPMQMLAETGWAGILAALYFMRSFVVLRRLRTSSNTGSVVRVFDVTLGMLLLYSLLSIHMDYLVNKFVFFLLVAATLVGLPMKTVSARRLGLFAFGVALILISPFWLSLLSASRLYASGRAYEKQGQIEEAIRLYQNAISLEPYHAESYWRLSQIHAKRFIETRIPQDAATAIHYQQQALRYKKDIHFLKNPDASAHP
jgi:tetratricopeptide (TPR) repeat protein